MKLLVVILITTLALTVSTRAAEEPPHGLYELRIYTTNPGRLDALNARFRDHTMRLFEKHGMTNIGYFEPINEADGKGTKLIYLLGFPDMEARNASFKSFGADPEWKKAREASEEGGKILVPKGVKSIFLTPTDYSMFNFKSADEPRTFALRIYTTPDGKLDALNSRFREHTCELFAKHGMTNIAYFTPINDEDGKANTLIYILAHPNAEAHQQSFASFRNDPQWQKVKAETEKDGSLTVKDGVKTILMTPTDYSPLK